MAVKARYNVSLPDHVSDELEKHAQSVGATPTEYAGDIIRWWFGQGAPAVRPDEQELRKRIKPLPAGIDAWNLNPADDFVITDDTIVQKLLKQLGVPNLFASMQEHDEIHSFVAFEDHPTHWIELHLWKGADRPDGNGLLFTATPKKSTTREQMIDKLQSEALRMGSKKPFVFSQLPSRKQNPAPQAHR